MSLGEGFFSMFGDTNSNCLPTIRNKQGIGQSLKLLTKIGFSGNTSTVAVSPNFLLLDVQTYMP